MAIPGAIQELTTDSRSHTAVNVASGSSDGAVRQAACTSSRMAPCRERLRRKTTCRGVR